MQRILNKWQDERHDMLRFVLQWRLCRLPGPRSWNSDTSAPFANQALLE